jgi:hypothetical protein
MSLAAHGPRLIDAFLKLKTDKLRGAVADLAKALAQMDDNRQYGVRSRAALTAKPRP